MKKTVLVLMAMMLSFGAIAQFKAAPVEKNLPPIGSKAPFLVKWMQLDPAAAWTVNDINGNPVSLQSYLNDNKFVLIDFSCTWCGPCWNLHNSGFLEAVQALDDFQAIWIEIEETNTTAQIYGPQGGSSYADMTYGNWTVDANGDPVTYPIIDDDADFTCLTPFMSLFEGSVPTLMLIAPNGQYCNATVAWSYANRYDNETGLTVLNMIAASFPDEYGEPQPYLYGPERAATGSAVTFEAIYNSYSDVTAFSWSAPDGNPSTGSNETFTTTFNTDGEHMVILGVTNPYGTAYDTLMFPTFTMPENILSYTFGGENISSIGAGGPIYWAVAFPPSMLQGRNSVEHVECYVDGDQTGAYTMSIYSGTATAPVTLKGTTTKNVTAGEADAMVNFTTSAPVAIDQSQYLWIVMNTTNVSYPAAYTSANSDDLSKLISNDGATFYVLNQVFSGDGSWMIDVYTSDETGSISRLNNIEMSIYPNPASDKLTVNAEGVREVSVLDITGRTVATSTTNVVDLTSLSAGSYIVRVVTNEGTATQKFVKE